MFRRRQNRQKADTAIQIKPTAGSRQHYPGTGKTQVFNVSYKFMKPSGSPNSIPLFNDLVDAK
jgi:hypothetical protein